MRLGAPLTQGVKSILVRRAGTRRRPTFEASTKSSRFFRRSASPVRSSDRPWPYIRCHWVRCRRCVCQSSRRCRTWHWQSHHRSHAGSSRRGRCRIQRPSLQGQRDRICVFCRVHFRFLLINAPCAQATTSIRTGNRPWPKNWTGKSDSRSRFMTRWRCWACSGFVSLRQWGAGS